MKAVFQGMVRPPECGSPPKKKPNKSNSFERRLQKKKKSLKRKKRPGQGKVHAVPLRAVQARGRLGRDKGME